MVGNSWLPASGEGAPSWNCPHWPCSWPLAPGPQLLLLWQRDRFLQVGLFIIHALPLCKACWEQRWQQLLATSTRAGHKGAQRGPLYLSGSVQSCWAEGQGLCLLRENE